MELFKDCAWVFLVTSEYYKKIQSLINTMSNVRLNLIAAACNNMGIGVNGTLPWKLKKEMKHFNVMSTGNPPDGKQNVVIMGRKSWFSIPPKFRPLKNRINIVLSTTLTEKPEGSHHLFHSLDGALRYLNQPETQSVIDQVWVIGGHSVYKAAMESPHCHRIYLTRIFADIECDTFFPAIDENKFDLVSDPKVDGEMQEENGMQYKFLVYERRCMNHSLYPVCMTENEPCRAE